MRSVAWDNDQRVTQGFGLTPWASSYHVYGMIGHNGIDAGLQYGVALYAPEAGTAYTRNDPPGYGQNVKIVADDGGEWVFAHLQDFAIPNGQRVDRGTPLGHSGGSGNSTGPHLHLGYRPPNYDPNNGYFGYIDPRPKLAEVEAQEDDPIVIANLEEQLAAVTADRDRLDYLRAEAEVVLRDTKALAAARRKAKKLAVPLWAYLEMRAAGTAPI